ncbi:hypothetical protein ZWY2020_028158 [Hordeum vulgare]|nr:hypothetical protein ZWY2020_028158 [Hordeum vulgare]
MKAAVTLLASSTFLVPRGATAKIENELLPVVAEPDNIAEFDFCDYVVEGLRVAARKLREDLSMDVANVKLEGCLIVPQIMWLDYHEHGLHGRETLQLPRIGHYSDTKLKDLIRKHATAQGIECGLEVEVSYIAFNSMFFLFSPFLPAMFPDHQRLVYLGHAHSSVQAVALEMVGVLFESRSCPLIDMDNLPLLPTKVVEAFKATMEFHYKRCEVEMMKVVDNMRDKIAVEIRAASFARRQRDAEEALDFFIGQVKKQASMAVASQVRVPHQASGSAAPKVHVTHGASASTSVVARDLAAISREAAKSMMELDVCAQHSADAGASCSHGLTYASTKGQQGIVEGSSSTAHDRPGGELLANLGSEPHDKCMVVDLKCKGIATGVPRPTHQQTMHELLPPAPNVEAAAPNAYHEPMIDTSFLYLMTEAVIPAEEYFAQEEEYGFSPFELELSHTDMYPDHVCQNFYEDFIYLSCAKSLSSTWYKSSSPTILVMDGHKMKYQFRLGGAMFHNGMEAWVRGFNEREKKMFDRVGLPVSRGLLSPDVPIMVPIAFDRDWCLYVFDKLLKRLSVLDPIFTGMAKEDYRDKHGVTIDYMLKGCSFLFSSGESPGYIAYYADNFNGTRLEEDIPRAGLASRRKRMLYETLAAQCNTAPRAGFMVQVAEEI